MHDRTHRTPNRHGFRGFLFGKAVPRTRLLTAQDRCSVEVYTGQRKRNQDFLRQWSLQGGFVYKGPAVSAVNPQANGHQHSLTLTLELARNFALQPTTIHLVFHTMFSRVAALTLVALPLLAAATPLDVRGGGGEPASSCSTGDLKCCNSVKSVSSESRTSLWFVLTEMLPTQASDPSTAALLGLLGIAAQGVTGQVGLTCSPVTVIGLANGACSAKAVCCQDNSHVSTIDLDVSTARTTYAGLCRAMLSPSAASLSPSNRATPGR